MDINTLRGILTIVIMLAFLGLCIWVYSRKSRGYYDSAARMAIEDQAASNSLSESEEHSEASRDE